MENLTSAKKYKLEEFFFCTNIFMRCCFITVSSFKVIHLHCKKLLGGGGARIRITIRITYQNTPYGIGLTSQYGNYVSLLVHCNNLIRLQHHNFRIAFNNDLEGERSNTPRIVLIGRIIH